MKKLGFYLLTVYMALQLIVPGCLVFRHYNTLVMGEDYKFIVVPYDPYDPFRGRYVALRVEQFSYSEGTYALLDRDEQGFAVVSGWSAFKPKVGDYAKNLELNRYYMNEAMAPEAERIQRNLTDNDRLYLLVKVKSGSYVIEGLYLNDIPIEQYIVANSKI